MANINIHVRPCTALTARVAGGSDKGYLALRLDWFGGDEVAVFFESEEQLFAFEEKVSTAVRAFQQSRDWSAIDRDKTPCNEEGG